MHQTTFFRRFIDNFKPITSPFPTAIPSQKLAFNNLPVAKLIQENS